MARFVDYERNPGFWFLIQLSIAAEICSDPEHSAKNGYEYDLNSLDIMGIYDEALLIYEKVKGTRPRRIEY